MIGFNDSGFSYCSSFSAYKVKSIFEVFIFGHTDRVVEVVEVEMEVVVVGLLQAQDNGLTDYRDTDTLLYTGLHHEYSMSLPSRSRKGDLVSANY